MCRSFNETVSTCIIPTPAKIVAPSVEVRVIEGAGHFPLWQQGERFVSELSHVLEKDAR